MQHYVKNLPLDQNFSKAANEIVVGVPVTIDDVNDIDLEA